MAERTSTIGETLTEEQREELKAIGHGDGTQLPTDDQERTVRETLDRTRARHGKGRKTRPSSKSGPITPAEFSDLIHNAQNTEEVLGNKEFVDAVFSFIKIENNVGQYQIALGDLVTQYKAMDSDLQKAIRVRLADGKSVDDRQAVFTATKTGLTATDELLMVLFYDQPDMFEVAANRRLVCRNRMDNWIAAYKRQFDKKIAAASEEEREAIREKMATGAATTAEIAALLHPVIGQDKPKGPTTPRRTMSVYSLLADMILLIGHKALAGSGVGPELPIEERINLENRIKSLATVADGRFDYEKLDKEIDTKRETLNDRVQYESKDAEAKANAPDVMESLKETAELEASKK